MTKIFELIKENRQRMLTKDEFMDVRNEIGAMMNDISVLKSYKDDYKDRHLELDQKVLLLLQKTEKSLFE